ncbi:MAG: hypothetical protein ACJZ4L_05565 [Candidatus Poriferisodalaceae bacterium]
MERPDRLGADLPAGEHMRATLVAIGHWAVPSGRSVVVVLAKDI